MKTKILLLILSIVLISCNNDDIIAQETETNIVTVKNRIPESFIGEYKHHYGEDVTGTISITDELIIINTSSDNYDIDITSPDVVLKLWCKERILDVTFVQCKKKVILRITNWMSESEYTNYITLSKNYNVVGNFDPIESIPPPIEYN